MVAIKDFEMPKNCAYCNMCFRSGAYLCCVISDEEIPMEYYNQTTRPKDCPLVEIKENKDGKID